jgi:cytoskeleton protein RodZ
MLAKGRTGALPVLIMNAQDQPQSKSPPWGRETTQAKAEFGAWLRRQREVRDVHLDEVVQATKVGRRYLNAFEEGRFELLPAPVFAKGFLREYARYVGLDADEVVNSYLTALHAADGESEPRRRKAGGRPSGKRRLVPWFGAAMLVALIALGAWWLFWRGTRGPAAGHETVPSTAAIDSVAPGATPKRGSVASLPQVGPLALTLDFRRRCWVELEIDGQPAISEEHLQGESLTVHAQSEIRLSLDHPEAVDAMVNGASYPLEPGPDGQVRNAVITLEEGPGAAAPGS